MHSLYVHAARNYLCSDFFERRDRCWLILHGYGQLAEFFIRKFKVLEDEGFGLIVPEGPHRFYTSGVSGRMGASWMTKRFREQDIKQNHDFLDQLYSKELMNKKQIGIIGFSQGAATAARWVAQTNHRIDRMVLWSSMFPPDLDVISLKSKKIPTLITHGTQDEYRSEDQWTEQLERWKKELPSFETLIFEGGHEVKSPTLKQMLDWSNRHD